MVPVIKPPAPEPRWKAPDPAPVPLPVLAIDDPPRARWLSTPKILAISGVVAVLLVVGYLVNAGVPGKSTKQVAESSPAVQQPAVPPPQTPPPTQPDSNPRVPSTSGGIKGKSRSADSSQAAKAFHGTGSWRHSSNEFSKTGERAQLLARRRRDTQLSQSRGKIQKQRQIRQRNSELQLSARLPTR